MSRVDVQIAKQKFGKVYPRGCCEFVCDLLGRPLILADSFRRGAAIGSNNQYSNVSRGDIVGFPGHVAIYVGEPGCMFIDVNGAGNPVRIVRNGYGNQTVYKCSYN